MLMKDSVWYMFFEAMNTQTGQGDIVLAVSKDGFYWDYRQIVLDEAFHLTYPYVIEWKSEYYMIPESYKTKSIRLYKAVNFPTEWLFTGILLEGDNFVDSSIFRFKGKWWLFTSTIKNNILYLYYADNINGPWIEHPKSPIVDDDANIARPAGRVLVFDNRIIGYAQDDYPIYGSVVRAFEIIELTNTVYREKSAKSTEILKASGTGWNAERMHHIDPYRIGKDKYRACVDGGYTIFSFGVK